MQQKHHEKIFYLASAENKMNLYRANYASSGNELLLNVVYLNMRIL